MFDGYVWLLRSLTVIRSWAVDWSRVVRSWCVRSWWWRSRVVRSWGWSVCRSRLVCRLSFVFNISDVSVFVVGVVGDNLGTTIGKGNTVFSADNTMIVLVLSMAEGSSGVGIIHTILIVEGASWLLVMGLWNIRSWMIGGWGRSVGRSWGISRSWSIGRSWGIRSRGIGSWSVWSRGVRSGTTMMRSSEVWAISQDCTNAHTSKH